MRINSLKSKNILVTGGTGSFGDKVISQLLIESNPREIRVLSRDEKKQDDLRKKYQDDRLKFFLGDVRDKSSIYQSFVDVDYVFHAAALKQVPSCEFFPLEATKTNVIGTDNVLDCAIENKAKKVICLSTDKAVYPINAMGISKSMMEKVAIARSRNSNETQICITRYGNVMGSRGSVIPLFLEQAKNDQDLTITDESMTRFMMTLEDAVSLVIYAFENGNNGDLFVQKSPSCTIGDLAKTIIKITNSKSKIKVIGTRHGEKHYEVLCSKEEMLKSEDLGDYIKVEKDKRDLNYAIYFDQGKKESLLNSNEYSSKNTHILESSEIELLLKRSGLV